MRLKQINISKTLFTIQYILMLSLFELSIGISLKNCGRELRMGELRRFNGYLGSLNSQGSFIKGNRGGF